MDMDMDANQCVKSRGKGGGRFLPPVAYPSSRQPPTPPLRNTAPLHGTRRAGWHWKHMQREHVRPGIKEEQKK